MASASRDGRGALGEEFDVNVLHVISHGRLQREARVATVAGLDEELGFLDEAVGGFLAAGFIAALVGAEEVLGELAAGERIEKHLGIEELLAEALDDGVRGMIVTEFAPGEERGSAVEHGLIGELGGLGDVLLFEGELGFESLAFAGSELEINGGDHFAGALADAHVAEGEDARVVPVRVERGIRGVGRNFGEVLDHELTFGFADAADVGLEGFAGLALLDVAGGDARDGGGNALGGDGADGQAVGAGVFGPLAAEDDLEVGGGEAALVAADAVEAEIGNVMLAAGVETAADLDAQVADGVIGGGAVFGETLTELAGQAAGGRDAQLAGIGAGAGGDVDDGAGSGGVQTGGAQAIIERRQIGVAYPAQDDVLLDCGADGLLNILAADVGEGTELIGGEVAEGQGDGDGGVAGLALLVDVIGLPGGEAGRGGINLQERARGGGGVSAASTAGGGPAGIGWESSALFEDEALELFEAELDDQELQPGGVPVLLFAQPGEDAGHGLGQGEQFFDGQELIV